ncbi:MAG: anhydro-N-acetylmuramic acid kinase [Phycisphaerales bacterium]
MRDSLVGAGSNGARRVVGVMTGTSLDGIDAALVEIEGHGLDMTATLCSSGSRPLPERCTLDLRAFTTGEPLTARRVSEIRDELADEHASLIETVLGDGVTDLICLHGQTVFHDPPLSWQLLNPTRIARRLRAPVVFDLRAADLAEGGEGAPITPLADDILFRHPTERRLIVNLGGFANATRLPSLNDDPVGPRRLDRIDGGDICVCNQLLDTAARRALDQPYDRNGGAALRGSVDQAAFESLRRSLSAQAESGRSLGTGDELMNEWLDESLKRLSAADLCRTITAAIAEVIASRASESDRVLLAGGGARNEALRSELRYRIAAPVELSDAVGVPLDLREAMAMAVLGALCADRVAITLPQVTRVPRPAPIAGAWVYPNDA